MTQTLEEVKAIADQYRMAVMSSAQFLPGFEIRIRVEGDQVHVDGWRYGDRCCCACARKLKDAATYLRRGAAGDGPTLVMNACIPCMERMGREAGAS